MYSTEYSTQDCWLALWTTVEPLYSGYHWDQKFRPLLQGVLDSGAFGIFPVGGTV